MQVPHDYNDLTCSLPGREVPAESDTHGSDESRYAGFGRSQESRIGDSCVVRVGKDGGARRECGRVRGAVQVLA